MNRTMHVHAERIKAFYGCLDRHDAEGMVACYGPSARFSDPVFGQLDEQRLKAMWRMLCGRATDLRVVASAIDADDATGHAHWDATYTWKATGRLVRNSVDASFVFRDGHIVEHDDRFSLRRWIGMALGPAAGALGWLPPVRSKVRAGARAGLEEFMRERRDALASK